jgi:hypothetical protein
MVTGAILKQLLLWQRSCALTLGRAGSDDAKTYTPPPPEARVDINLAAVEELRMTRTRAARIVRFKPYHAKNDFIDRGVVTSGPDQGLCGRSPQRTVSDRRYACAVSFAGRSPRFSSRLRSM